jgi:hypothetical protein
MPDVVQRPGAAARVYCKKLNTEGYTLQSVGVD